METRNAHAPLVKSWIVASECRLGTRLIERWQGMHDVSQGSFNRQRE
jgi:hypothetical protein